MDRNGDRVRRRRRWDALLGRCGLIGCGSLAGRRLVGRFGATVFRTVGLRLGPRSWCRIGIGGGGGAGVGSPLRARVAVVGGALCGLVGGGVARPVASSALRCGGAGTAPVSGGRLESTSAPKLSFSCDGSGRAGFGCVAWKDTLAAGSDVTLNTGRSLSQKEPSRDQQGPGHRGPQKISIYFNYLRGRQEYYGAVRAGAFSARRQDLPFQAPKTAAAMIACGGKICRLRCE